MKNDVYKIGFWSAIVACLGATAYSLAQIISPPLLPILKYPVSEILIIAPSLVIPLTYIIAMNCLNFISPEEKKIWSQVALSKSHWIQAVDGFGYSLMSVSTLFAAFFFAKTGIEGKVRRSFIAHGLLAPFIILPLWIPPAIVIGTLWFITGPLSLLLLALFFRSKARI